MLSGGSCRTCKPPHAACRAHNSMVRRETAIFLGISRSSLGPLRHALRARATVEQFPAQYRQVIRGHGGDRKSGSRVTGSVDYRLSAISESRYEATRVEVVISYALTGLLAQLGRSGLARDLARRIGETFAQNIDAQLSDPSDTYVRTVPNRRTLANASGNRQPPARTPQSIFSTVSSPIVQRSCFFESGWLTPIGRRAMFGRISAQHPRLSVGR